MRLQKCTTKRVHRRTGGSAISCVTVPGGATVTDTSLAASSGVYSGVDYIEAIRTANIALYNKDIPEDTPRYAAVSVEVFDAIKYAKDSTNNYLS